MSRLASTLSVLAVVLVAVAAWVVHGFVRHGKMDENGWRIRRLASILEEREPHTASRGAIREALRAAGAPEDAEEDSWGRPFDAWVGRDREGRFHYSIRSLGADRKPGPCCVGRWLPVDEADGDWVIIDGQLTNEPPRTAW